MKEVDMGRSGVTMTDVAPVAEQLRAQGINPTATSVRRVLERGSYSTLKPLLDEWLVANPTTPQPPEPVVASPLPPQVAQLLERATQELWAMASEVADNRLQEERAYFQQQLAAAEEARSAAAAFADEVEAQSETLETRIADLEAQLAEAHLRAEQERVAREGLSQELAAERAARFAAMTRVEGLEAHNGDLNAELQRVHAALSTERDQHAQARATDRQQHAAALERAAHTADERLAAERARTTAVTADLQSVRAAHDVTVAELRQQLDQARSDAAQALGAAADLRAQVMIQARLLEQAVAARGADESDPPAEMGAPGQGQAAAVRKPARQRPPDRPKSKRT